MSAKDVSDDNQQNDSISSSSSTSSSTFYHQHLKHYHHHLLPLLLYSLAKIFQSSTYLILLIWLYELLPPSADCSAALKAAFTVAHLSLAVLAPLLLFAAVRFLAVYLLNLLTPFPNSLAKITQAEHPTSGAPSGAAQQQRKGQ